MEKEIKEVVIPATSLHEGWLGVKVKLFWECPKCGKKRKSPHKAFSFDGSRRLVCHSWDICDCGYNDRYDDIRKEAGSNGLNSDIKLLNYTQADLDMYGKEVTI